MISWNRFYDPDTGRYISADPIGLAGGMNLYGYVGENPVNRVDLMGLLTGTVDGSDGLSYLEGANHYFLGSGNVNVPFNVIDPEFGLGDYISPCSYSTGCHAIDEKKPYQLYSISSFSTTAGPGRIVVRLKGKLCVKCDDGNGRKWSFSGYVNVYTDKFDFDPRPWGERKWYNEYVTRWIFIISQLPGVGNN